MLASPLKSNPSNIDDDVDSDPFNDQDLSELFVKKYIFRLKMRTTSLKFFTIVDLMRRARKRSTIFYKIQKVKRWMKTMDIKFNRTKAQMSCVYFYEDGYVIFFSLSWYSKSVKTCDEQFETFQDNVVQSGSSTQRTTVMDTPTRKTFKDLFPQPQTTPLITAGPTLYEDTMKFRVSWGFL